MSHPFAAHIEKDGFRLRGLSPSRIDSFSDAVFAFALTLLVVSLEVPKTYADLAIGLRGFIPFAISFSLLITIWVGHYRFFRRFGTHDMGTIWINSALLFVVLFYVYPLKFLFSLVISATHEPMHIEGWQTKRLMMFYGLGFAAIYLLMAALYWNGFRQRHLLELTRLEQLLTRSYISDRLMIAAFGLLSSLIAVLVPNGYGGYSGLIYLLVMVARPVMRALTKRRIAKFHALHRLTDPPLTQAASPE